MKRIQVTKGDRFGRLTVVEEAERRSYPSGNAVRVFVCKCDCGATSKVVFVHLRSGHTKTCGCANGEKHGKRQTREYRIWRNMKSRCLNPKFTEYPRYGGRGITISREWVDSFQAFFDDMGECPSGHSIERVDNNGEYCQSNCIWATASQQARNRRSTRLITYQGKTLCITDWANLRGIDRHTISRRLNKGLTIQEALAND